MTGHPDAPDGDLPDGGLPAARSDEDGVLPAAGALPRISPQGVLPAIATLVVFGGLAMLLRHPAVSDVTTTPEDPPRFRSRPPGDVAYPERAARLQEKAYPDLAPFVVEAPVPETYARALTAARSMRDWKVVFESDSLAALQATAGSRLAGFADDVVVEVRAAAEGSEIHVRSRSRFGRADFGANARRNRAFLAALE